MTGRYLGVAGSKRTFSGSFRLRKSLATQKVREIPVGPISKFLLKVQNAKERKVFKG